MRTEILSIQKLLQCKNISLAPPLSVQQVQTWEEERGVRLPEDYFSFLTNVGDGGTIVPISPNCDTLISFNHYEEAGYSFSHIMKPFTLEKSWIPDWGDTVDEKIEDENELERLLGERRDMIRGHGTLTLMEDKTDNHQRWFLVVNGPCYGEVWMESELGVLRYPGCSFSKWLSLLLNGKWAEYEAERAQEEQKEREDRTSPQEKCHKALKRYRIKMNPPAQMEEIKRFEDKHHIRLPEDYIQFLTEIGNGGKASRMKYPKLYSLSELDSMTDLDAPFFIQTREQLQQLNLECGLYSKTPYLPWPALAERFQLKEHPIKADSPWIHPILYNLKGCLPLFSKAISQNQAQLFYILNGDFQGEIWTANQFVLVARSSFRFPDGEKVNAMNFLSACLDYGYGSC